MNKIKFCKLQPEAVIPAIATEGSRGYDLTCIEVVKVLEDVIFLGTGLAVIVPEGYHTELVPRSSISKFTIEHGHIKVGLQMANSFGLVDADYTGNLIFAFRMTGNIHAADSMTRELIISKIKQRLPATIGQLIIRKSEMMEVEEIFELPETARGSGGFGSTSSNK